MKKRIAIVDYGMGNLRSVQKALERVGAEARITQAAKDLRRADAVVLPGVGAFGEAVKRLKAQDLWKPLKEVIGSGKPFLGICLGLQLLFEGSDEAPGVKGLGIFKGRVVRFRGPACAGLKVPHMGWNRLRKAAQHIPELEPIQVKDRFYFVHSYYPAPRDRSIVASWTDYGVTFCSSVAKGSLFACQFHPEKSGALGLGLLKNFMGDISQC